MRIKNLSGRGKILKLLEKNTDENLPNLEIGIFNKTLINKYLISTCYKGRYQ